MTFEEINEIAKGEENWMIRNAGDQITTAFVHGFKYCERMQAQKKAEQLQAEYNAGYKRGCHDRERLAKEADNAYQRGLDDAWAAAKKIASCSDRGGYSAKTLHDIFSTYSVQDVFEISASEAIEKIRAYKEKQKQEEKRCSDCINNGVTTYCWSYCDEESKSHFKAKQKQKETRECYYIESECPYHGINCADCNVFRAACMNKEESEK